MEDDKFSIVLILLFGGVAVWWILNRQSAPTNTTVTAPPCNVGGSYNGVGASVSCAEFEKGLKVLGEDLKTGVQNTGIAVGGVKNLPSDVINIVTRPTGSSYVAPIQAVADRANAAGKKARLLGRGIWGLSNDPLSPGTQNYVMNGNTIVQGRAGATAPSAVSYHTVPGAPPIAPSSAATPVTGQSAYGWIAGAPIAKV